MIPSMVAHSAERALSLDQVVDLLIYCIRQVMRVAMKIAIPAVWGPDVQVAPYTVVAGRRDTCCNLPMRQFVVALLLVLFWHPDA